MLLFRMALLYSTISWLHLDTPGHSNLRFSSTWIGLHTVDMSHTPILAGSPLSNLATGPTPAFIEIVAPSPGSFPVSSTARTSIPTAVPNHDSPSGSRPSARTAAGTTAGLVQLALPRTSRTLLKVSGKASSSHSFTRDQGSSLSWTRSLDRKLLLPCVLQTAGTAHACRSSIRNMCYWVYWLLFRSRLITWFTPLSSITRSYAFPA